MIDRRFSRRPSRRSFLRQGLAAPIVLTGISVLDGSSSTLDGRQARPAQPDTIDLTSPDGRLKFLIRRDHRLAYSLLFLAIMNGPDTRTVRIPLSFLNIGKFQARTVRDRKDDAGAVEIENAAVSHADTLTIEMRAGGGFIARFSKRFEKPDA
jgi:hypothetical protein